MDHGPDAEGRAALARFLRERSAAILDAWEAAVRALPPARELARPALRSHVPQLLEYLAELALSGRPAHEAGEAPYVHALERVELGFDLEDVMREYTLLRRAILECHAHEAGPLEVGAVTLLGAVIDEAITVAVASVARVRQRTLGALDRLSSAALTERASPERLLARFIEVFTATIPAVDLAAVLLVEGDRLRVRAAVGLQEEFEAGFSVAIGEGFEGMIAATQRPQLLRPASEPSSALSPALRARGARCVYGVPLVVGEQLLGVAYIGSRTASDLSSQDQVLFRTTAARAADALAFTFASLRERAATAAARAFGSSSSLDEGVARLLGALGGELGWDIGAYWTFDPRADVLRCEVQWVAETLGPNSALFRASAHTAFAPGEGLPGSAWSSGEPAAVADLAAIADNFPRSSAAREDGLRSALAFPLKAGDEPLGVIELFSTTQRSPLEEATQLTAAIADQAGEFARRLVAQERSEADRAFYAAILEVAVDAIVSMDAEGRVTAWNPAATRTFGYTAEEALGRTVAELIIPVRLREAHRAGIARYLATGEGQLLNRRVEVPAVRKDGTELTVELTITRVPVPGPPSFTGHLRDLTERRRAEQEVRAAQRGVEEARAQLDALVTKAPVGIAFLDRELRYVRVNERIAELNGVAPAEHVGRRVTEVLPNETGQAMAALLERVLSTGEPAVDLDIIGETRAHPGERRHWAASFYPVPGHEGRPLGIGAVVADVTERRRAEADLAFLEEASRVLTRSLDYARTLDEVARLAVPRLADWCGVEMIDEAEATAELVSVERVDATTLAVAREARRQAPSPDGPTLHVLRTGEPLLFPELSADVMQELARDAAHLERLRAADPAPSAMLVPLTVSGRALGVLSLVSAESGRRYSAHDLARATELGRRAALAIENARLFAQTERAVREREEALARSREAEARLRVVLEAAPAAVFVKDREGRYTLTNPGFGRAVHSDPRAAIGKTDREIFPQQAREAVEALEANDRRVLESGEPLEIEEVIVSGGESRTWLTVKYPLKDEAGVPYAVCGIATDMTERKELEQTRERFVGILGHDLRNPLGAIDLGAQLLASSTELAERDAEVVRRIASSATRMRRMVADLLDFARGRLGGGIPLTTTRVELAELVTRVVREIELARPGSEVRVETRGDVSGCWDPDRLAQVLANLVSNALTHGVPGRPVRVSLDGRSRDAVALRVENEAECPSSIDLTRVFDPFRRGGAARADAPSEGLGLGLYITREIVRAHGGSIEAACTEEQGFTIVVRLPRARTHDVVEARAGARP